MQSSKLIKVLKTLTSQEWSSFRKYLLMHTGKTSDNFQVFEILQSKKAYLDQFDSLDAFRSRYFPQLTNKGLANLMSKLYLWLEDWLIIDALQSQEMERKLILHRCLNDRGLFDMADKLASKLHKQIDINSKVSMDKTLQKRQLIHQTYYSENPIKYKKGVQLIEDLLRLHFQIIEAQSHLYEIEIYNIGRVFNHDFVELKNRFIENDFRSTDELNSLIQSLKNLILDDDLKAFQELKEQLFANTIEAPSELHTLLTLYLLSSSLKLHMQSKLEDKEDLAILYDYALSNRYFFVGSKIPRLRFHNILAIISETRSKNETSNFIDRWISFVDTKSIEHTYSLAKAQNYFHHGIYDQIIPELIRIEFEDYNQKFRSIALQAIALLMDENLDRNIVLRELKNFRRVIERFKSKVSMKFYLSHINLIKVLRELEERKYKKHQIDLSTFTPVLYKSWLERQIRK